MVVSFFFYLFSLVTLASAFMVISARNPVTSVLFLILAFVNCAGLFLLLGAEFLAMLLVIVYVGAVAVLFLFVVMMLDVDFAELKRGALQYLPIGAAISLIVVLELVLVLAGFSLSSSGMHAIAAPVGTLGNTQALGAVIYSRYVYFFEVGGLILLVAMIGAIVLTLHHKPGVKRQNVALQVARTPKEAVEIKKVPFRQGV